MASSDPSSILPPLRFYSEHTYTSLKNNPANRYIFRVHRSSGPGARIPGVGFVAPRIVSEPTFFMGFTGHRDDLEEHASAHVLQWQWKVWRDGQNPFLPSCFVSASFSFAYALHEAGRWNTFHGCTDTQISVIDTWALGAPARAWLATEFVGATGVQAAFFARWAEEVLVFGFIPHTAIVLTAPLNTLLACLPRWCAAIAPDIRTCKHRSTQDAALALAAAAAEPGNNTQAERDALAAQSVARSIALLQDIPPTQPDRVDTIARFAALLCWWPRWITGTDPVAYPALLRSVEERVRAQLAPRRSPAVKVERSASGVVRTPSSSPRKAPYSGRPLTVKREEE
ncbi:hypothetical protein B0H11DRAFT_1261105 [Mycena galericulata]|nr:hypothetical protein B0H11DRAFT_1261105 [Mycena galericulata]